MKITICIIVLLSIMSLNAQSEVDLYHYKKIDSIVGVSQIDKDANKKALTNAYKLWAYTIRMYSDLNQNVKGSFIAYHFHSNLKTSGKTAIIDVEQNFSSFLREDSTQILVKDLSRSIARRIIKNNGLINQQEVGLIASIKKSLVKEITKKLKNKIKVYKPLIVIKIPAFSHQEVLPIIRLEQKKYKVTQNDNSYKLLEIKAKKAGLEGDRVVKLVELIKEKEEALKAIKLSKKDVSSISLFEVNTEKTVTEVKQDFSKSIANLITKKEYAAILGDDLRPSAKRKAKKDIADVQEMYALNEEQLKEVSKNIRHYYFNETIVKHYYNHNRQLQKQKLSGLRYRYEKEFKEMMRGFNVQVKPTTKANNNTFQY